MNKMRLESLDTLLELGCNCEIIIKMHGDTGKYLEKNRGVSKNMFNK